MRFSFITVAICVLNNFLSAQTSQGTGQTFSVGENNLSTSGEEISENYIPFIILKKFPAPADGVGDIEFDGQHLWVESFNSYKLFQISTATGTIIRTIPTNVMRPYGLAFDGSSLWLADANNNTLQKIDTANGNVLQSFSGACACPTTYPAGLAWDGSNLWNLNTMSLNCNPDDSIYKINCSGQTLERHKGFGNYTAGLAFDGQFFWVSDNCSMKIYKVNKNNLAVVDSVTAPGGQYPNGLGFDGQTLWVSNNASDSIYQLYIGYGMGPASGIASIKNNESVIVAPNPSENDFIFRMNTDDAGNSGKELDVIVSDPAGKKLFQKKFSSPVFSVNMEQHSAGMYYYTITNKSTVIATGKLLKR
jgi:DNA-binding beta-propeller fold protein YncE